MGNGVARIVLSVLVLVIPLLVWVIDVYAGVRGRHQDTVSATLLAWCHLWPLLPFAGGCLAGHVLWPQIEFLPAPIPAPSTAFPR